MPSRLTRESVIRDYRTAFVSRQASLLGRREVFTGKAKFGIFGDGKEVPQIALAHAFRKGDFRSGYYRDQTLMLALGMLSIEQFFAQLYAHADVEADPGSAGRSMTAHFATRTLNADGSWRKLTDLYNSAADVSPTASQMPRMVGLGYASKLYRELPELSGHTDFSDHGNEVVFGTIGNASCAEGLFWESVNAIGVLQVPTVISIWDDGYGISVPNEYQITDGNLTQVLSGFQHKKDERQGYEVYRVKGWDYAALYETYREAAEVARRDHLPAIIHVTQLTQPQGHSTSGSHERYKNEERLAWEREHDCIKKMREWMIDRGIATADELERMEEQDKRLVVGLKNKAWDAFSAPIRNERDELVHLLVEACRGSAHATELEQLVSRLQHLTSPMRRDLMRATLDALVIMRADEPELKTELLAWERRQHETNGDRYGSHLHSASARSAMQIGGTAPVYDEKPEILRGFEVLNRCFDAAFAKYPEVVAFGQDVGKLGDVNQGLSGLQEKHGDLRISDAGIREATIVGQGIGIALRGLRPIVEIQYLDYLLYALQVLSDDLATLHYRTKGGQKAPVIIRTRGHRLEGIWHSGSPMSGILNLLRGIWVCVPRDMTRAAGFYNTLLQSDDSALIVEVLNGYRLKEPLPSNIGEFCLPLGVPEVLRPGGDVTLVTYGACCRVAGEAADLLGRVGVETEVIDVQTLLPFDRHGRILESLKKTGRIAFVDEDVPGGATAYLMQQVLEAQGGYAWLDSAPVTVTARAHRPAYGSDGDYFSKSSREDVFRAVYDLMHEADPHRYPAIY